MDENQAFAGAHWIQNQALDPYAYPYQNPHFLQGFQMVPGWQAATSPEVIRRSLIPIPLTAPAPPVPYCHGGLDPSYRRESPPETLHMTNTAGFVNHAPHPPTSPWDQVHYDMKPLEPDYGEYSQISASPKGASKEPHLDMVPRKYRKVVIKYPKFGLEDFDFKYYNKTLFAGLETNIPNAYCNCMIQVLYFLEPIRCFLQNHSCQREFCLACELGFLFHMLDLSRGAPCQATNFLRAFRMLPEVSALGLKLTDSDEQTGKANLGGLIQSWNRFIITQLQKETKGQEGESVIGKLFGCEVENSSFCRCGNETIHSSLMLLFNMHYPEQNSREKTPKEYDFAEILKKSICLEKGTQEKCDGCKRYQPTLQTQKVQRLPDVLVINCEVNSAKEAEFWKVQAEYAFNKAMQEEARKPAETRDPTTMSTEWYTDGEEFCRMEDILVDTRAEDLQNVWIPATLKISINKTSGLEISSWPEGKELSAAEEAEGASLYDLVVTVPHILDPYTSGHLVAHIKVGETYHKRKEGVTHQQWYLFNDFLIEPINKTEAAQFDVTWKVPAILYYAKRNYHTKYDLRIKNPIDARVLQTEPSLDWIQSHSEATFFPLAVCQLPQAGDLVGLDAEFVKLKQEVVELLHDGTKSTIKPSQMSVARISCVRGQGLGAGYAFIDDYISTQEQVVDYLTQYSGIEPGDLDARISSKHLTTLKSTYLKLRFLIDSGVCFVGHGLQNDFRAINLLVPKDQVIDTVQLFRLPRRRLISLRFLAWYFLGLEIQGETHNSTEDARTALLLYRKYQELRHGGENKMREVLKELYDKGRQLNFKVPDSDKGDSHGDPKGAAAFPSAMEL